MQELVLVIQVLECVVLSAQSTNITINGIPYNDAESLGTFWVNLGDFASSVESLTIATRCWNIN